MILFDISAPGEDAAFYLNPYIKLPSSWQRTRS
jgi:hypothetical protein